MIIKVWVLVEQKMKLKSMGEVLPHGKSCDVAEINSFWATKRSFVDIIASCFLGSQPEMDGYSLLVHDTIAVSILLFCVHG